MNPSEIYDAVRTILSTTMNNVHMDGFSLNARLNEDLYLDSVLLLEVFLNLELEYGLSMPEQAIAEQDLNTVSDLIALFAPRTKLPDFALTGGTVDEGVHGEAYYDLKVHCFISCLCDGLKKSGIDHRPFYFGVWDAKFAISDQFGLQYHSPDITQDFFRDWFTRLYKVPIHQWYDPHRSKTENLETLIELVDNRSESVSVMVMLDMFHLPERENKFNQNPFPHFLMLRTTTDPDTWFVHDPDFRWEGVIARNKVAHAIMRPTVGGGYVFDNATAQSPNPDDISAFFEACFIRDRNPLVDAVCTIVNAHVEQRNGLRISNLAVAVRELPVIIIRKYAYEHGFAFFWRALKLPAAEFETWCEVIDSLVQALKSLHYACMKLSQTQDLNHLSNVHDKIREANDLEKRIKDRLGEIFLQWKESHIRMSDYENHAETSNSPHEPSLKKIPLQAT